MVKVRLSTDELVYLNALTSAWGLTTRAATVRALLRSAEPPEVIAAASLASGPSLQESLAQVAEPDRRGPPAVTERLPFVVQSSSRPVAGLATPLTRKRKRGAVLGDEGATVSYLLLADSLVQGLRISFRSCPNSR
jgi:hypothetical protein